MNLSELIDIVKSNASEQDRRFAVIEIGEQNTMPGYEFLIETCDDSNSLISAVALFWVAEMNFDIRAYNLLIEKIESPDALVRSFAAKSLGNTKIYKSDVDRAKAIELLLHRAISDAYSGVRMYSLMSLKQLQALEVIEPLKTMLENETNLEVQREVAETIKALSHGSMIGKEFKRERGVDGITHSHEDRDIAINPPISTISSHDGHHILRDWWHDILRKHDRYPCYAIFLALDADDDVKKFLSEYGRELEQITSDDCLVIALATSTISSVSFNASRWSLAVQEHISEGYSIKLAHLMKININDLPCMVLFEDIRSSNYLAISLVGMDAKQINQEMRTIFTEVHNAVLSQRSPLSALQRKRQTNRFTPVWKSLKMEGSSLVKMTLETLIETAVKSIGTSSS